MQTRKKNRFSIQDVKDSKRLVKFYTGLQNYVVFMWIYNRDIKMLLVLLIAQKVS